MAELKFLIDTRKFKGKQITETFNKSAELHLLNEIDKITKRNILMSFKTETKDLDTKIQRIKFAGSYSESELEEELKLCADYEAKVLSCLSILDNPNVQINNAVESNFVRSSLLRSPVAPLPVFEDREGEDLTKFIKQFEDTISRFNYSDFDKLLLLKQQVRGKALVLINSLEIDRQGYQHAVDLLKKALASPELRIFNTIKDLSELKLKYSSEPYLYISKIRNIQENFKLLEISIEHILQYFLWIGLNDVFQGILIQITNNNRPTLEEINKNIFLAAERYMNDPKIKFKGNCSEVSLNAAKVNFNSSKKSYQCQLCLGLKNVDSSHPIFKCPKFSNPKSKLDRIKILKGCQKCGYLTHTTEKCKYHLKSECLNCKKWHMSFLCNSFENENKNSENAKNVSSNNLANCTPLNEVTTSLGVIDAFRGVSNGSSILPTFTFKIGNTLVRALKDGGCQSTFIADSLAQKLNLEVIEQDISLTVNGINNTKVYKTKIVKVPISLKKSTYDILALCLRKINISLTLPGLNKVVTEFLAKGYDLADKYLWSGGDAINNIDFILGTKDSYCLPDQEILFGKNKKSVYCNCESGVMLVGEVETLLDDLSYLPRKNCDIATDSYINFNNDFKDIDVNCNIVNDILDHEGNIIQKEIDKAVENILESRCNDVTCVDNKIYPETYNINNQLVNFALERSKVLDDGRLEMPLLWNDQLSHLLGQNFGLSKAILKSLLHKFKNTEKLLQIDSVFKEQEASGIIEKINNIESFYKVYPDYSFLPFMAVFKPDRDTTKCRVVFLSNLHENDPNKTLTVSHNQAIHPGPNLNQKLFTALTHTRFGKYLLAFDLVKAFNQISLNENDQSKLLFIWFRDVKNGDFSHIYYKNVRLSFGLRCSPTLLMLSLYKMLVIDDNSCDKIKYLKLMIYALTYVDNCSVVSDDPDYLKWAYSVLNKIFNPYKFSIQQLLTNEQSLKNLIKRDFDSKYDDNVKLLGIQWNTVTDQLATKHIELSAAANTKRLILKSIASHFDVIGVTIPLMNRAKIFFT